MLCADSAGLPSGGRGTDRDIGDAADDPPYLALLPLEGERSLCGGRGTLWFIAICVGSDRFDMVEP